MPVFRGEALIPFDPRLQRRPAQTQRPAVLILVRLGRHTRRKRAEREPVRIEHSRRHGPFDPRYLLRGALGVTPAVVPAGATDLLDVGATIEWTRDGVLGTTTPRNAGR